jgi:site-specific DNA-cytosine methylase
MMLFNSSVSTLDKKKQSSSKPRFTFMDAFAGIGGFHLALNRVGGTCASACEIDPFARETYLANFSVPHFYKDITLVDAKTLPDFDLFCAGFPCQPFSVVLKIHEAPFFPISQELLKQSSLKRFFWKM